jgi:hypothetical protein
MLKPRTRYVHIVHQAAVGEQQLADNLPASLLPSTILDSPPFCCVTKTTGNVAIARLRSDCTLKQGRAQTENGPTSSSKMGVASISPRLGRSTWT